MPQYLHGEYTMRTKTNPAWVTLLGYIFNLSEKDIGRLPDVKDRMIEGVNFGSRIIAFTLNEKNIEHLHRDHRIPPAIKEAGNEPFDVMVRAGSSFEEKPYLCIFTADNKGVNVLFLKPDNKLSDRYINLRHLEREKRTITISSSVLFTKPSCLSRVGEALVTLYFFLASLLREYVMPYRR